MSLWSLSAEIPGGVLAPCIVLGALLGRIYAVLLPEWSLGAWVEPGRNSGEEGTLW